ncbi:hypothetical protein QM996_02385 [Sinorhizobium chiapasense]
MFGVIAPETALLILVTLVAVLIMVMSDVLGRLNAQAGAIKAMAERIDTLHGEVSSLKDIEHH